EQDRTGFYEAAYTRDHGTIHKHKTRYDRVWIGADLLPNTELADCDGETAMTVDDERWLVDATGTVWVRMKAGKEAASSTTVTETSRFHLASELPDATGIGSFERDADRLVAGDFFGPDRDPYAQQQADALVSKGLSVASLLGDLRMAGDSGQRGVAQLKMSALFRAHPTTVADATAAIRSGQLSKEDAQAVLGSLRDAATPVAIDALASVLGTAGVDNETRSAAAASMSLAKTTTPAAVASLRDAAADPDPTVRSSSILALGGVVPQAGGDGAGITSDLLGSLDRATSAEDRALYIRALGNAGQASAYPAIVAALDDPSPLVQTAAVAALRFIDVADVDPLLDRIATTNDDADVRENAVFAIGFRTLAMHNTALGQVARVDAADTARLAAIDLLGREVKSDPAVRAVLLTCAAQDPSADVRARAATAAGS
ncbi:MAG TPA: HEAT repeat domain-containing protein, partial [Kofleriaceae bacterium]|nr:HEAT repeat domain-containing protein [Kofleriaceae bacterium]